MPSPDCSAGRPCHRSHGKVRLILDILEDGKVGDIRIEEGNPTLAGAAAEAAQQAEFVPGTVLGKTQGMNFILNVTF